MVLKRVTTVSKPLDTRLTDKMLLREVQLERYFMMPTEGFILLRMLL